MKQAAMIFICFVATFFRPEFLILGGFTAISHMFCYIIFVSIICQILLLIHSVVFPSNFLQKVSAKEKVQWKSLRLSNVELSPIPLPQRQTSFFQYGLAGYFTCSPAISASFKLTGSTKTSAVSLTHTQSQHLLSLAWTQLLHFSVNLSLVGNIFF